MTSASSVQAETESAPRKKVLIVEDHEDVRAMMSFMLSRKNLVVLEACNGQEAIEVASDQHPDLILMDLSMPVMDGFTATQHLKALDTTKSIPIVVISAHCQDAAHRDKALNLGCRDCLKKPVDWSQLENILLRL